MPVPRVKYQYALGPTAVAWIIRRSSDGPSQEPPETAPPLDGAGAGEGVCAGGWSPPLPLLSEPPPLALPELLMPELFELPALDALVL
ncbi:MAG: hypothetical protein ACTHQQ_06820 [Solirubrobacteraceae bacterium]